MNAAGAGAILVTYLNLAWKNTRETQISFHATKIMFPGVKTEEQLETGMWNLVQNRPRILYVKYSCK